MWLHNLINVNIIFKSICFFVSQSISSVFICRPIYIRRGKEMIKRKTYRTAMLLIIAAMVMSLASPIALSDTETQQSTKLTLQVYPDASVRWVGEYCNTTNVSTSGTLLLNLTQLEKGLKLLINGNINNLSNVSNTTKLNMELSLKIKGRAQSTKERVVSQTNFNLYINDKKNEIVVRAWSNAPIKVMLNKSKLYAEIMGNVSVTASGSNAIGLIFALSLLNKNYTEKQLAKHNITYVDVKELETTTGPAGATIVFDIGINYTKMIEEQTNKTSTTSAKVNPEKLKELLETYFIPYNTTYSIIAFINSDSAHITVNVNSTLSVMQAANLILEMIDKYSELYGTAAPATPQTPINMTKGVSDLKKFLGDINETLNKFEILPSSAYLLINVTNHKVRVKYQTFKIRAKGAKSPEDTLKTIAEVVQNLRTKLSNTTFESKEGKEVKTAVDKVLGSEAVIEGVGGVKVSQTRIPLSKLGEVKVEVTQTTTSTTTTTTLPTSTSTITTSITQTTSTTTSFSTTTTTPTPSTTSSSTTTTLSTSTSTTTTSASTSVITSSTSTTVTQTSGLSTTMIIVGVIAAIVIVGAVVAVAKR